MEVLSVSLLLSAFHVKNKPKRKKKNPWKSFCSCVYHVIMCLIQWLFYIKSQICWNSQTFLYNSFGSLYKLLVCFFFPFSCAILQSCAFLFLKCRVDSSVLSGPFRLGSPWQCGVEYFLALFLWKWMIYFLPLVICIFLLYYFDVVHFTN